MFRITALCIIWLLASASSVFAQYSIAQSAVDSSLKWSHITAPHVSNAPLRSLRPASFIVPGSLILVALSSFDGDGMHQANLKIREELVYENPHANLSIDNYLQFAPAVAVYGLNAIGVKGKHGFVDRTLIYGMANLMVAATVYTGKSVTHQWRPDGSAMNSFPSGHTATAFASAEFLRREYQDQSPWYGIAGYAAAGATGFLRMYNNRHWLGDVLAGAGVGILATDLSYWLYPHLKHWVKRRSDLHTLLMPTYHQGAVGFVVLKSI